MTSLRIDDCAWRRMTDALAVIRLARRSRRHPSSPR